MAKKKGSRGNKARAGAASQAVETPWTELERAFFASAPPDAPAALAQPERFDDLDDLAPAPPARRNLGAELRAVLAALRRFAADLATAPYFNRRSVTIAIASAMLLVGLSAAVFASR